MEGVTWNMGMFEGCGKCSHVHRKLTTAGSEYAEQECEECRKCTHQELIETLSICIVIRKRRHRPSDSVATMSRTRHHVAVGQYQLDVQNVLEFQQGEILHCPGVAVVSYFQALCDFFGNEKVISVQNRVAAFHDNLEVFRSTHFTFKTLLNPPKGVSCLPRTKTLSYTTRYCVIKH